MDEVLELFADLVAGTAKWQALTGAANAAAAREFIYFFGEKEDPGSPAMVLRVDSYSQRQAAARSFLASGSFSFDLDLPRKDGTRGVEYKAFLTDVRELVEQVLQGSKATGTIDIRSLTFDIVADLDEEGTARGAHGKRGCWSCVGKVEYPAAG